MLNLVINEYEKTFKKKSTLICAVIFLVLSFGMLILSQSDSLIDVSYYFVDSDTDMSQASIKEELSSYESDNNTNNSYYQYLSDIDTLQLYDQDDQFYEALSMMYYSIQDNSYTEDVSTSLTKATTAYADGDYDTFYTLAASLYSEPVYTFEGNENAITNPFSYCKEQGITPDDELFDTVVTLMDYQSELEASPNDTMIRNNMLIAHYILDNKLSNYLLDTSTTSTDFYTPSNLEKSSGFASTLADSVDYSDFMSILLLVIAGSIVANEFSNGTIKFLLINPVKRSKILMSKLIMIVSAAFLYLVFYYIVAILFSFFFNGTDGIGCPYLSVSNDTVTSMNSFIYVAQLYGFELLSMVCYGLMALMISSFLRSSGIAIAISIVSFFSGSIISLVLANLNQDWGRYLLFSNVDIQSIMQGETYYARQTVGSAVIVIAIHMIVFFLIAYDSFTKREV